jgi:hypothetical protein
MDLPEERGKQRLDFDAYGAFGVHLWLENFFNSVVFLQSLTLRHRGTIVHGQDYTDPSQGQSFGNDGAYKGQFIS